MDVTKRGSLSEMGPFIPDNTYVAVTRVSPGFGDILLRCNSVRCLDGTIISAAEVAVCVAEALNVMLQQHDLASA